MLWNNLCQPIYMGYFCQFCLVGKLFLGGLLIQVSGNVSDSDADATVIRHQWQFDAAQQAFVAGLPVVAERHFRSLLAQDLQDPQLRSLVGCRIACTLIAQKRFEAAKLELAAMEPQSHGSLYFLYNSLLKFASNSELKDEISELNTDFLKIEIAALTAFDRVWYSILQALIAELNADWENAQLALNKALLDSRQFSNTFSLLIQQALDFLPLAAGNLRAQEIWEPLLDGAISGAESGEVNLISEAFVLQNAGQTKRAIQKIEAYKKSLVDGTLELERTLLLQALFYESGSRNRIKLMEDLLSHAQDDLVLRSALYHLANDTTFQLDDLENLLTKLIQRDQPHPLLGRLYYMRSYLLLYKAEAAKDSNEISKKTQFLEAAEADARFIMEQLPGVDQFQQVYRVFAHAALLKSPPHYRAAADYFLKFQQAATNESIVAELNQIIGDCYYLNEDYQNAVDYYALALKDPQNSQDSDQLYLRWSRGFLHLEPGVDDFEQLDAWAGMMKLQSELRWQVEWNVTQYAIGQGLYSVALNRTRKLLQTPMEGPVSTILDLQLHWMEAYLAFLTSDFNQLSTRIEALLQRISALPADALPAKKAEQLLAELKLLLARTFLSTDKEVSAMLLLEDLRIAHASSEAVQRSYWIEAEWYAQQRQFQLAQSKVWDLASAFPNSEIAIEALFKAALYCEKRGGEYFLEAIQLHENFIQRYPQNQLVFHARMRQGDLLRKLNDFAGAQLIYQNLNYSHPEHPFRYLAELARADCLLALAGDEPKAYQDALFVLEGLIDLPQLPLDAQAEVGYKWGIALLKQGRNEEALKVFTQMTGRLLLSESTAGSFLDRGQYWLSRTLLEMGKLLKVMGDLDAAQRIYQKLIAYNLPGRAYAQDLLQQFGKNSTKSAVTN